MQPFSRITISLPRPVFIALQEDAEREDRDPRRHAAFLLRRALGCIDETSVIHQHTQNQGTVVLTQEPEVTCG